MRYWYDLEFLEDGRTIELISIGIVAEDGREYYAVAADAPWERIARHPFLGEHVVPYLPLVTAPRRDPATGALHFQLDRRSASVKPTQSISLEVQQFLPATDRPVELWAYYGAYDHVALNQLWGPMAEHPVDVPMYTNDLMQTLRVLDVDRAELPQQASGQHHALADARHNRVMWAYLDSYARNLGLPRI